MGLFCTHRTCYGRMFGFALCTLGLGLLASAIQASDIVRVEEDWELTVATTDSNSAAPQVTTAISPVGNLEGAYATLELNHQSVPNWEPGGVHLVPWDGEYHGEVRKFPNPSVMSGGQEVVTWTQGMHVTTCSLTYYVENGASQTWGSFGGQGYLRTSVNVPLTNLNAYDPAISVENSGVTYAANRVTKLVLKRVRRITADGQVLADNTERVVHGN